jgi:hypothetical protein
VPPRRRFVYTGANGKKSPKRPAGFRKLSQLLPVPYWNVLTTHGVDAGVGAPEIRYCGKPRGVEIWLRTSNRPGTHHTWVSL